MLTDNLQRFGYVVCALPRQRLIQLLYDHLPDKSVVHAGKSGKVITANQTDKGVELFTEDGSIYRGDLVVGCDGIHSKLRGEMWKFMSIRNPDLVALDQGGKTIPVIFLGE